MKGKDLLSTIPNFNSQASMLSTHGVEEENRNLFL